MAVGMRPCSVLGTHYSVGIAPRQRDRPTKWGQGRRGPSRSAAGVAGAMEDELAAVFAGGVIGDELATCGRRLIGERAEHAAEVGAAGERHGVAFATDDVQSHLIVERDELEEPTCEFNPVPRFVELAERGVERALVPRRAALPMAGPATAQVGGRSGLRTGKEHDRRQREAE
jgi:hypothetical protein